MRLTRSLLRILANPGQLAPGKIDTGKNRIYPTVTRGDLKRAKKSIQITERNILLLRHPYLTIKESYGLDEELHDPIAIKRHEEWKELEKKRRSSRHTRDWTMEERFAAVDRTHSWDS